MDLTKLDPKTDHRGTLVEAFTHSGGQVHYIIINPGETRGNHYHTRKIEEFILVSGTAIVTVKNRFNGDVFSYEASANDPVKITVVPHHTHKITAGSEGAVVISWNSEVFDPEDTDTYLEEV